MPILKMCAKISPQERIKATCGHSQHEQEVWMQILFQKIQQIICYEGASEITLGVQASWMWFVSTVFP